VHSAPCGLDTTGSRKSRVYPRIWSVLVHVCLFSYSVIRQLRYRIPARTCYTVNSQRQTTKIFTSYFFKPSLISRHVRRIPLLRKRPSPSSQIYERNQSIVHHSIVHTIPTVIFLRRSAGISLSSLTSSHKETHIQQDDDLHPNFTETSGCVHGVVAVVC
jgi:hypothetical protein